MAIYDIYGAPVNLGFASPEGFGAVGDGVTDDTVAFQSAVSEQGLILCEPGKTYKITDTIRIAKTPLSI